ncbi:hypothetical protein MKX03_022660, partial [Papaver bracteatum]
GKGRALVSFPHAARRMNALNDLFATLLFLMHCIHFPRKSGEPVFRGAVLIFWIVMLHVYIS